MSSHLKIWGLSVCMIAGLAACKVGDTETKETDTKQTQTEPSPAPDTAATTLPATPVELTAEGDLQSVDLKAMTFSLKDASGAERKFSFSSSTRITGVPDAQGLAAKKGSRVTIGYIPQGDTNSAVWIEIGAKPGRVGLGSSRHLNA